MAVNCQDRLISDRLDFCRSLRCVHTTHIAAEKYGRQKFARPDLPTLHPTPTYTSLVARNLTRSSLST